MSRPQNIRVGRVTGNETISFFLALLYGSEIWIRLNATTVSVQIDSFNPFNALSDLPCEKLHIRKKYVHRKATYAAVFAN